MESIDCAVIGAGVVGLAIARALALSGHEVIVLEAAETIGTGVSSRNSEVIHAGIYYPQGSLKARLCVSGKHALYRYCATHGIDHQRCGKLIVASDHSQLKDLAVIKARAEANGVEDLRMLSAAEVANLESELYCAGALLSPSTGIIDSHGFMLALQGDAEAAGVFTSFLTPVVGGRVHEEGIVLRVGGRDPLELLCRRVVNSAGLKAPGLARKITEVPPELIPRAHYAKGNYFSLTGPCPFRHLIYPVPEPGGLGTHLTLDLAGRAKFGPDVEWVEEEDYSVDPNRAQRFFADIRRYWPGLSEGTLQPAFAGIRPKISGPDRPTADFVVQTQRAHGIPGLVNLFGIESPGLTASLAIADFVAVGIDP